MSAGRKLAGAPVLLQDWGSDGDDERAAQYWELFLDLLLVAAATSVAEVLEENRTAGGLSEFASLYFACTNGWFLYTHHITARFEDSTLLHSLVLFFYLLGMACCIVNASYETAAAFSFGAVLQRSVVLVMLAYNAYHIPRARDFCAVLGVVIVAAIICFVGPMIQEEYAGVCFWVAAVVELCTETVGTRVLAGRRLLPINIEHSKDRLNCLVLIMMGETVISSTLTYKSARDKHGEEKEENGFEPRAEERTDDSFYTVLALCFLLIFMFTLLYFHMQPAADIHAFRQSRIRGNLIILAAKILGMTLLLLGVSVKLMVEDVARQRDLSLFTSHLMGLSVGFSLLMLFFIRVLHYGGNLPRPDDPPNVRRLFNIWWWTFGIACFLPFLAVAAGLTDPVAATATYAGLIFVLCVMESWYTHLLMPHLPGGGNGEHVAEDDVEEKKLLNKASHSSYNT